MVESITDQFNCESTEENEFDNINNQTEDESFRIVYGLHNLVIVIHKSAGIELETSVRDEVNEEPQS